MMDGRQALGRGKRASGRQEQKPVGGAQRQASAQSSKGPAASKQPSDISAGPSRPASNRVQASGSGSFGEGQAPVQSRSSPGSGASQQGNAWGAPQSPAPVSEAGRVAAVSVRSINSVQLSTGSGRDPSLGAWGRPAVNATLTVGRGSSPAGHAGSGAPAASGLAQPLPFSDEKGGNPNPSGQVYSSDEDSESGEEGGSSKRAGIEELEDSIFGKYYRGSKALAEEGGAEDSKAEPFSAGIDKIRDQLLAAQSGAARCLICLERIKGSDPVWDCKAGCHCTFHLVCIQAWARQAANAAAARAAHQDSPTLAQAHSEGRAASESRPGLAAAHAALDASWHCPKCRTDYSAKEVPREYRCFCGKQRDPEFNPWLAPHTCGEACERKLPGSCGHKCTLLCHPGPCPPCPQLVRSQCHCGKTTDLKRCGHHEFSCAAPCGRQLSCGVHRCDVTCHAGECPPCPRESEFTCRCGRSSQVRACAERDFGCGQECGKSFPCGRHKCEKVCHAGPCGGCPLAGKRSCPCGKVSYGDLPCDRPLPTCGSTCEKPLACGRHTCPERCHTGPCADTCRVVIAKRCRCGGLKKEVPCSAELHCERRCQRQRNCERHACKRRCCDGACPPCSEVCGKKLRCGNHKCPAPCHSGPCAPCPVTVRIACACDATAFTVPCGAEREQRPPRCSRHCTVTPRCRHGSSCKPHRCHYGACPPCALPCGEPFACGHTCPLICHGPRPVPRPEYTLRPRKQQRRGREDDAAREGRPCPPCAAPVGRPCLGRHPGGERTMPCSADPIFHCDRPCGNPLACGNHRCQRPCHAVTLPRQPDGTPALPFANDGLPRGNSGAGEPSPDGPSLGEGTQRGSESCSAGRGGGGVGGEEKISTHGMAVGNGGVGGVEGGENGAKKGRGLGARQGLEGARSLRRDEAEEDEEEEEDSCEQCTLKCQKPRDPPCPHPCQKPCHLAPCPPCRALVKRACHCGAMVHVLDCCVVGTTLGEDRVKLLSCKGPCHKKLPFCTHLCPEICHAGPCPRATECRKKVTVRCACQRIKKEWLCCEVQVAEKGKRRKAGGGGAREGVSAAPRGMLGVGLLPCDLECIRVQNEKRTAEAAAEEEQLRQRKAAAAKLEAQALATGPRRRKQRSSTPAEVEQPSWLGSIVPPEAVRWVVIILVILLTLLALYGAMAGLQELSQYLNSRDAQRRMMRGRARSHKFQS